MLNVLTTEIDGTTEAGPPATLLRLKLGEASVSGGLLWSLFWLFRLIAAIAAVVLTSPISYHRPPLVAGMSIPSRSSEAAELLVIVTLALFGAMKTPVPPSWLACTS